MEIGRFDAIEYDVLKCAYPNGGGYYAEGERADRALTLMREGILVDEPERKWQEHGWILTKFGEQYRIEFMQAAHEKHGHEWLTNRDTDPKFWSDDEYADRIDVFAYSIGYHNGPKCKNCGYEFCQHCKNEMEIPECTNRPIDGSARDVYLELPSGDQDNL